MTLSTGKLHVVASAHSGYAAQPASLPGNGAYSFSKSWIYISGQHSFSVAATALLADQYTVWLDAGNGRFRYSIQLMTMLPYRDHMQSAIYP